MSHPQQQRLAEGATALGLSLAPAQHAQLLAYLDLLAKWNKVYNLTAVRDPAEMLTHHLLDSLAVIAPLVRHTQGGAAARRFRRWDACPSSPSTHRPRPTSRPTIG